MRIQSNLGSLILPWPLMSAWNPATHEYAEKSCARTYRWLDAVLLEHNAQPDCVKPAAFSASIRAVPSRI